MPFLKKTFIREESDQNDSNNSADEDHEIDENESNKKNIYPREEICRGEDGGDNADEKLEKSNRRLRNARNGIIDTKHLFHTCPEDGTILDRVRNEGCERRKTFPTLP